MQSLQFLCLIIISVKIISQDGPHFSVHLVPVVAKPCATAHASGGSERRHERLGRRPSCAHHTDALPPIRPQGVTQVT